MIKAVTFDLWNTLFCQKRYSDYRINVLAQTLDEKGFSTDRHIVKDKYSSAINHFDDLWERNKAQQYISAAKLTEFILKNLGVKSPTSSMSIIAKRFEEAIFNDPPPLMNDVETVLKSLHDHYKIGLICNSGVTPGRILRKVLKDHTVLNIFGARILR